MDKIYVREGSKIAQWAARNLNSNNVAIVVYNTIFLYGASTKELLENKRWLRHEIEHVRQWKKYGFIMYILMYLYYSLKYGYHENPFETEARKSEKDLEYLDKYIIEYDTLYKKGTGLQENLNHYAQLWRHIALLLGIFLTSFILWKALTIEISPAEYTLLSQVVSSSTLDLFLYGTESGTVLYALLLKGIFSILGEQVLYARVFSCITFFLYFFYVIKWARKWFQKDLLGLISTTIVLSFIPFLLSSFYSAEGFGLTLSIHILVAYYMYNTLYTLDVRQHYITQTALCFLVISQIYWLPYFIAMQLIILLHSLRVQSSKHFVISIGGSMVGLGLIASPLWNIISNYTITQSSADGFFETTFLSIFHSVFSSHISPNAELIYLLFFILSIVLVIHQYLFCSRNMLAHFGICFLVLILISILLQKADILPLATDSKILMYFPVLGLLIMAYLRLIFENRLAFVFSSLLLIAINLYLMVW